jgi:hypothetical protein
MHVCTQGMDNSTFSALVGKICWDSNFIMIAIETYDAEVTFFTQDNILNNHVKFGKSCKGNSVQ